MVESIPGLPKLVQHFADYVEVFGIEVESDLTLESVQIRGANNKIIRMGNLDNLSMACENTEPLLYKLS